MLDEIKGSEEGFGGGIVSSFVIKEDCRRERNKVMLSKIGQLQHFIGTGNRYGGGDGFLVSTR